MQHEPPRPFQAQAAEPARCQLLDTGNLFDRSAHGAVHGRRKGVQPAAENHLLQGHAEADQHQLRAKLRQPGHGLVLNFVVPAFAGHAGNLGIRHDPRQARHGLGVGLCSGADHGNPFEAFDIPQGRDPVGGAQPVIHDRPVGVPRPSPQPQDRGAVEQHNIAVLVEGAEFRVRMEERHAVQVMAHHGAGDAFGDKAVERRGHLGNGEWRRVHAKDGDVLPRHDHSVPVPVTRGWAAGAGSAAHLVPAPVQPPVH